MDVSDLKLSRRQDKCIQEFNADQIKHVTVDIKNSRDKELLVSYFGESFLQSVFSDT